MADEITMQELIVVEQLPVIREKLEPLRQSIQAEVDAALELPCTEETLQTVKKLRASLRAGFAGLEDRRKDVKRAVLAPYEEFEGIYRECVTDIYGPADEKLKERISSVEDGIRHEKADKVIAYFNEYRAKKGIDFVGFDRTGITVTMSASLKSLREQAKAFIDKVAEEVAFIEGQEHAGEIMVEYRKDLNAMRAVNAVNQRHKDIEAEKQRQEEAAIARENAAKAAEKARQAATLEPTETPPMAPPIAAPVVTSAPSMTSLSEAKESTRAAEEETEYCLRFKVWGPKPKLAALKQFLDEGDYRYE